jgi:hypothetical protein
MEYLMIYLSDNEKLKQIAFAVIEKYETTYLPNMDDFDIPNLVINDEDLELSSDKLEKLILLMLTAYHWQEMEKVKPNWVVSLPVKQYRSIMELFMFGQVRS